MGTAKEKTFAVRPTLAEEFNSVLCRTAAKANVRKRYALWEEVVAPRAFVLWVVTLSVACGGSPTSPTSSAATAGAATTIALTSGNNQSAVISTTLANPFVVTVKDAGGNPFQGASVTFAIATVPTGATGQSLSVTSATTDGNGQASTVLTLGNKAGTYTVTATSGTLTGSPVTLTATATAGALTGLVREYASSNGDLDPVADVRVEIVSGSATGRNATTNASGEYRLAELPAGAIQLRVTKAGFQNFETTAQVSSSTTTFNMLVRRECSPWPTEVRDMMAKLSLPSGLCLIRQPNGRGSNYHTQTRTVYLRMGSPVGGEIGSLTHELGHAHQHQAVLEAGLSEPGFDDDFIPKWVSTREGTSFVELTGWRHDPTAPSGWTENCEPWSCGYQNPLEDAAEFTSNYYNVSNIFNRSDAQLRASAPNRFQWATEFLPK